MKFINYIEVNFNLFIIPLSSKFYLSLILNSIIKGEGSLKGEGYFRAAGNRTRATRTPCMYTAIILHPVLNFGVGASPGHTHLHPIRNLFYRSAGN